MKPVIVGLNNPHSGDPRHALSTRPVLASGYRLWLMLSEAGKRRGVQVTEQDYMGKFWRRNLLSEENYVDGRLQVTHFMSAMHSRKVVMCGTGVPVKLGFKHTGFDLKPRSGVNFTYHVIPHPSGLCRAYNDPEIRVRVGDLLFGLYVESHNYEALRMA